MFAFATLFIGSGKQKIYQQLVVFPQVDKEGKKITDKKTGTVQMKVDFTDKKKQTNLWIWGLLFYTQALPFVAVSNIIYFCDFQKMFSKFP